jgi:citrate:succinate antiporter/L-tartrate/succinate antiporter
VDVSWADWFVGFAPLGVLLLVLVPLVAYWVCRPEIKKSPEISEWAAEELHKMGPLMRNEIIMAALVVLTMHLWIRGANPNIKLPVLGANYINAIMVVLVVISLLLITGVVSFGDITAPRRIHRLAGSFSRQKANKSLFTKVVNLRILDDRNDRRIVELPTG